MAADEVRGRDAPGPHPCRRRRELLGLTTPAWQLRLDAVLRSWAGTPFVAGCRCRGRGCDCYGFLTGVMDELHGVTLPRPPRLPLDIGWNNLPGRLAEIRRFTGRYPCRPYRPGSQQHEPGDVLLVTRPGRDLDRDHHAAIVGLGCVWHAAMAGVCFTSLAPYRVGHAFRMTDRERWA